jgi:hypothetical protein
MKFFTEIIRKVWCDGECIEIGEDMDGLMCVEIRYRDKDNKIKDRIAMPPEQALLVAKAILACAEELKCAK